LFTFVFHSSVSFSLLIGIALAFVLCMGAMGIMMRFDRRFAWLSVRVLLVFTVQSALIALYSWGLYRVDSLWADVLWALLLAGFTAWLITKNHYIRTPHILSVVAGICVGTLLSVSTLLFLLKSFLFGLSMAQVAVPLIGLTVGTLYCCASEGVTAYDRCYRLTRAHRQYMLANGATRWESLQALVRHSLRSALSVQVRRGRRLMLIALPALLGGLLLAGMSPLRAVALMWTVALVVTAAVPLTMYVTILVENRQR